MSSPPARAISWLAALAYLGGGTVLEAKAINTASGTLVVLLLVAATTPLLVAAFLTPGWAIALPVVTFFPVWFLASLWCEPPEPCDLLCDLQCSLVWAGAVGITLFVGLPVAIVGTLLGQLWLRARRHDAMASGR